MEVEESRERLEDTAIPDLDDGLTDARAALLAEAHAALDEMTETVTADLREFNQDLPVEIRPAMQGCKGRRENVPRGRLDRRIRAVENCTAWRLSWG